MLTERSRVFHLTEVLCDTPWHVAQPNGTLWDTSLNETEALAWVEAEFGDQPSFKQ
ncbi:MAG: hypothetical protein ACI9SB_000166 [Candidatus Azotimanducaceae bacterium]|jgi:hypothetical protein